MHTAYERVINPIFMDNPELAGVMSTANSLKSAYFRSRLAHIPPLPVNAVDMQIPEEYRSYAVSWFQQLAEDEALNFKSGKWAQQVGLSVKWD